MAKQKKKTYGQRVRDVRDGRSVTPLAAAAGITVAWWYRIEQGHVNPSIAVAEKIAEALGCDLAMRKRG